MTIFLRGNSCNLLGLQLPNLANKAGAEINDDAIHIHIILQVSSSPTLLLQHYSHGSTVEPK